MSKYAKIIMVLVALLVAGSVQAQNLDFRFHWAPCPVMDGDGIAHPEAVEYEVYLSQDGGLERHIATVVGDTLYTLSAAPGVTHRIRVVGIDAAGKSSVASPWSDPIFFEENRGSTVPPAAALQQNYPNPFNPETRLVYGIPSDVSNSDRVQLDIFSLDGRLVRTMETERTPGWHEVVWDGTDSRGRTMATGMYMTRLVVGSMVQTNKMTMVK